MRTKKEIRDSLLSHPLYVKAVASTTSSDDRSALEEMMGSTFIDVISQMDEYVQAVMDDPELLKSLEGNQTQARIVTSEPVASGSL